MAVGYYFQVKTCTIKTKKLLQYIIMLSVKIGHYHPSLEDSFAETIQTLKGDNPLASLAVVAPTNWMLHRIQERIVQGNDASFMNVSFLNFSALAKEICRLSGVATGQIIQQSVIYEGIIAGLLKQQTPQEPRFKNVQSLPALSKALFRVIQDLIDANVHLDVMQEAVREGFVEGMEIQKLYGIIHLFDTFRQRLNTLHISHYSDVYRMATACVPDSTFLRGFQQILAYGFYDLTGVEQDFFGEIFRHYPTTLFLPYQKKHPAFAYVKPFYESFVLGIAHDVEELPADRDYGFSYLTNPKFEDISASDCGLRVAGHKLNAESTTDSSPPKTGNPKPIIINVSGKRDEVWAVAKEILKLTAEGYTMEEIGVVARSVDPYTDAIKKIFQENAIPFATSAQEPIGKYPLVKIILQVLQLKREDFYRPMVIDLLESPYFRMPSCDPEGVIPRPDLWDLLSRRLGIHGGIACWFTRLEQAKAVLPEFVDKGNEEFLSDEEGMARHIHIPGDQIELLKNILRSLSNDVSLLPEKASWKTMSTETIRLFQDYIQVPSEGMNPEVTERDLLILDKIRELLFSLCSLDCLGEEVTLNQFLDIFIDACRQEALPIGLKNGRGVKVLDAMSARGIPFRALFVLGLNEKAFPRAISEEPFLRDHVRRRLSEVLGNVIPEKLRGFDEERLLFTFLLNAARERLYLLYERSDETGKPKVQSHYLMDIIQTIKGTSPFTKKPGESLVHEIYVPRSIKEKLCKQEISLLTPKEIRIRMAFDRIDPICFMKTFGGNREAFVRQQSALRSIESCNPHLTPYDGIVGDVSAWWNKQTGRGLSPTTLETFGMCPFKFFMSKILELESLAEPEVAEMVTAVDLGILYHNILRDFYHALIEKGYFTAKIREQAPIELLHEVAQKYFTEIEQQMPIPYPIIWEIEKEEIAALLTRFVTWDFEQIGKTGYVPAYLEKTVTLSTQNNVIFGDSQQGEALKMALKGKIDRIDLKQTGDIASFRVIDYKSGRFLKENLMKSVIRGQKLQLPLYAIMAEQMLSEEMKKGRIPKGQTRLDEASFVYVAETEEKAGQGSPPRKTINSEEWMNCKEQYWETLWEFLKIIRAGIFPVSPAEDTRKCEWCEFSTTCRRGNQPLRFRLGQDARLKKYREIINLNVRKKSNKP